MFFKFILENANGDRVDMTATANQYMTSRVEGLNPPTGTISTSSYAGMDGSYWSRTLRPSNSDLAYNLLVTSGHGYQYYNFRDYGHTVRAVRVF